MLFNWKSLRSEGDGVWCKDFNSNVSLWLDINIISYICSTKMMRRCHILLWSFWFDLHSFAVNISWNSLILDLFWSYSLILAKGRNPPQNFVCGVKFLGGFLMKKKTFFLYHSSRLPTFQIDRLDTYIDSIM